MNEPEGQLQVPTRRDGTFKSFWYTPEHPWHIQHRRPDGYVSPICIGHQHG